MRELRYKASATDVTIRALLSSVADRSTRLFVSCLAGAHAGFTCLMAAVANLGHGGELARVAPLCGLAGLVSNAAVVAAIFGAYSNQARALEMRAFVSY